MNTTIRNLGEAAYRELKARAALEGKTVGEMINEVIRSYLSRPDLLPKRGSLRDLTLKATPQEMRGSTRRLMPLFTVADVVKPWSSWN